MNTNSFAGEAFGARSFTPPTLTQPINVGHFTSVPWIPNYCGSDHWPVNLVRCESSGVRELVEAGRLDVTPMAVADWIELKDDWKRLGNRGIAIKRRADSVLFFSQEPLSELDGADVAICGETQNSVRVLQALLTQKYGLRIGNWRRDVDVDDNRTPRLLIQNQAMEERARGRFRYEFDLGEEWFSWQGLPLVSAIWVHRADLDPAAVAHVEDLVAASMRNYRADPAAAVAKHRSKFGWTRSAADVELLHKNFDYELGPAAEMGIERQSEILPREVAGFTPVSTSSSQLVSA
ncbi:MqnA/MqnD/SBP family protein [Variovorax gossypii]|uniref:MqnA/MqnD/SBP family protein n=1 Tax=uncultured Variovorax sp. TaxID=114708 RepID=UPI00263701E9|nr:MqnA/MqnD/SBP family protein [uncultured Variovorax sp.]